MPYKVLPMCREQGCHNRAEPGASYCAEHLRAHQKREMDDYNHYRRDQDSQRFYNSALWRKTSRAQLRREPLCRMCLAEGRYTPAVLVDHIKPIRQGGDPLDLDNLQSLCNACHERKSQAEGSRFGKAPKQQERTDGK